MSRCVGGLKDVSCIIAPLNIDHSTILVPHAQLLNMQLIGIVVQVQTTNDAVGSALNFLI